MILYRDVLWAYRSAGSGPARSEAPHVNPLPQAAEAVKAIPGRTSRSMPGNAVNARLTTRCLLAPQMSTLTIRNLEPHITDKLRQTAAAHGRSIEEDVPTFLRQVLSQPAAGSGLGSCVHARFAALGGAEDVNMPPRTELPRGARFGDAGGNR